MPALGQKQSEETKRKISEALKKHTGQDLDETFQNYIDNHKGEFINIAKRYEHYYDGTRPELIQEGLRHLYEKIEHYDPKKAQFNTWAHHVLKNHFFWICRPEGLTPTEHRRRVAIVETTKDFEKTQGREPTSQELFKITQIPIKEIEWLKDFSPKHKSLSAPTIEDSSKMLGDTLVGVESIEDDYERLEAIQAMNDAIERMDKTTREVMKMIFGLGNYDKHQLKEVAKKMNVSSTAIIKRTKNGMEQLKKELKAAGFEKSVTPLTSKERKDFERYITQKAYEQVEATEKAFDRFVLENEVLEKLENVRKAVEMKLPLEKTQDEHKPFLRIRQRKPQSMKNLRSVIIDKSEAIRAVIGNLQDGRMATQSILFNQDPKYGKVWTLPIAKSWVANNKDKIKKIVDPQEL